MQYVVLRIFHLLSPVKWLSGFFWTSDWRKIDTQDVKFATLVTCAKHHQFNCVFMGRWLNFLGYLWATFLYSYSSNNCV